MRFIQTIKSLFSRPAPQAAADELALDTNVLIWPFAPFTSAEHQANYLASLAADNQRFAAHYPDFVTFFRRRDFDHLMREALANPATRPAWAGKDYDHLLDESHWDRKHYLNFPGPFYTGESDNCGTGILEAPHNVSHDTNSYEFIFRQPTCYHELVAVLGAAWVDPFESYSADGNSRWTYQACREWWHNKASYLSELNSSTFFYNTEGQAQLYIDYLNGAAETDLRRYCYFLENGVYPANDRVTLPAL